MSNLVDQIIDLVNPIDEIQDTFQHLGAGEYVQAVGSYVESLPAAIAARGAARTFGTKLVSRIVAPELSKIISTNAVKALDWYLAPGKAMGKVVYKQAAKTATNVGKAVSSPSGMLASAVIIAALAIDHGFSRLKGDRLSQVDVVSGLLGFDQTKHVAKVMDSKARFVDYLPQINGVIMSIPAVDRLLYKGAVKLNEEIGSAITKAKAKREAQAGLAERKRRNEQERVRREAEANRTQGR